MDEKLFEMLSSKMRSKSKIVVLCIGTDKLIFDSYGPFVGYLLKNVYKLDREEKIDVLGDLKEPVHALNLAEKLKEVDRENSLIIAVDAAVTEDKEKHKTIAADEGPILPGSAAGKRLPRVGDINIKGLIYTGYILWGEKDPVRLGDIAAMAEETAEYINTSVKRYLILESYLEHRKEPHFEKVRL